MGQNRSAVLGRASRLSPVQGFDWVSRTAVCSVQCQGFNLVLLQYEEVHGIWFKLGNWDGAM
jgi:hypothetical protein